MCDRCIEKFVVGVALRGVRADLPSSGGEADQVAVGSDARSGERKEREGQAVEEDDVAACAKVSGQYQAPGGRVQRSLVLEQWTRESEEE